MSEVLRKLNRIGLIEKLDGNDERFAKIETAASKVALALREDPPVLIRAILAGLDPDIPIDDPAIVLAADVLADVWTSVGSVYTDPPLFIYRSILLDACDQVAEDTNAVILWYTATDTLPLVRLGREESVVRDLLTEWARKAEDFSLVVPTVSGTKRAPATKKIEPHNFEAVKISKVNPDLLKNGIAVAVGPNPRGQAAIPGANPHWSNAGQPWSHEFTDHMAPLLTSQLDFVYDTLAKVQNGLINQLQLQETNQLESVKDMLSTQRSWLQDNINQNGETRKAEHLRLNTLWWCEALYSPSLCCSYRELDPVLAATVMPVDLLAEVQKPTPASVAYSLSETVNKLHDATFAKVYKLPNLLEQLSTLKTALPDKWADNIVHPPESGRLSLRDLVVTVLLGIDNDFKRLIQRSGLDKDFTISLPRLAQAIFRQEQAVILAEAEE